MTTRHHIYGVIIGPRLRARTFLARPPLGEEMFWTKTRIFVREDTRHPVRTCLVQG